MRYEPHRFEVSVRFCKEITYKKQQSFFSILLNSINFAKILKINQNKQIK